MGLLLLPDTSGDSPVAGVPPPGRPLIHLSTDDIKTRERGEFWQETVCRHFVDVEVTSKITSDFFGDLKSRPMGDLRLSYVRAGPHAVRSKLTAPKEDCVYAVILLEGRCLLEQDGREAFVMPGDLAFYDATRLHQLAFDKEMSMLLVHLSRAQLRERIGGLEQCTTRRLNGNSGVGAIVSKYIRTLSAEADEANDAVQSALAQTTFDLLATALSALRPEGCLQSRSRALSLCRVKEFIEQHLPDPTLSAEMISKGVGLSPRYINKLFDDGDPCGSVVRYVWMRRLDHCHRDLSDPMHLGHRVSDIALRWGFSDFSHFSRAFKARFNISPRQYRDAMIAKEASFQRIHKP